MTEEEQKASDELIAAIQKEKISTFEYCKHLSELDMKQLEMSGWRNGNADAVLKTIQRSAIKIEKMIQKHEKQFP